MIAWTMAGYIPQLLSVKSETQSENLACGEQEARNKMAENLSMHNSHFVNDVALISNVVIIVSSASHARLSASQS